MPHGADLSELTVKQLQRRQQPITSQGHDAQVRQDVGEIASLRREQQHSHNQTAESERFQDIARAVTENGESRVHPRDDLRMAGEAAEEMLFSTMNFHRFNSAEHLVRFAKEATDRYS